VAAPPVFIVGSQRSGTTLLRLLLNAHSRVAIPEEGTFWMPLIRSHWRHPTRSISRQKVMTYLRYITKNPQFELWGMNPTVVIRRISNIAQDISLCELMAEFYNEYARREGKEIWGEKSPSFFRKIIEIQRIFPEAKFIHIVRDGRDVYLSWKNNRPGRSNIPVAALEWKHKVEKIENSFKNLDQKQHLTIRYEDLVNSKTEVLKKVCSFLNISFEETMLDFWKRSNHYIGSHHSELIFKPISKRSLYKWEKMFSTFQSKAFELLAGGALKRHNYKLVLQHEGLGIIDRFKISLLLIQGLPLRAGNVFVTSIRLWVSAHLGTKTNAAGGGQIPSARIK
jgi:hypothetical protein